MDILLEQPVVTYIALMLATVFLMAEIALPTFGVAGAASLALAVLGFAGIAHQSGLQWWPLVGAALAVVSWVLMLALHRPNKAWHVAASVLFAGGSLLFGILARDIPTIAAAVLGSAAVPALYPRLQGYTRRLMEKPPEVGMESLVGKHAKVTAWSGNSGTVMLDGSYWDASSDNPLEPGDEAQVAYFEGMRLFVRPVGQSLGPPAGSSA